MYLVEINVRTSPDSPEKTVWRLLRERKTAEKLWYQLDALTQPGMTVDDDGVSCQVLGAWVWAVDEQDRDAAIRSIDAGRARVLKDTGNPIFEIDEEILEWIREPLARLPPDDVVQRDV